MHHATKWTTLGLAAFVAVVYTAAEIFGRFTVPELARSLVLTGVLGLGLAWVVMQVADETQRKLRDDMLAWQSRIVNEAIAAIEQRDAERTDEIRVQVLQAINDQAETTLRAFDRHVADQIGQVFQSGLRKGLLLAVGDDDGPRHGPPGPHVPTGRGVAAVRTPLRSVGED